MHQANQAATLTHCNPQETFQSIIPLGSKCMIKKNMKDRKNKQGREKNEGEWGAGESGGGDEMDMNKWNQSEKIAHIILTSCGSLDDIGRVGGLEAKQMCLLQLLPLLPGHVSHLRRQHHHKGQRPAAHSLKQT